MTVDLEELKRQDAAYAQQAAQPKEQKAPGTDDAFSIFLTDIPMGTPVSQERIHAAIAAADRLGNLVHPLYSHVRDSVVAFQMDRKPGKVNDAVARLCIPLVGYARLLGYVRIVAGAGHIYANAEVKPRELRFADLHAFGQHTQQYFLDALKALDDAQAHIDFINLLSGIASEEALDKELRKHAEPVPAAILVLAATALKDGMRAMHSATASGASTTDDLIPSPKSKRDQMHDYADSIGAAHVTTGPEGA